jgi:hypothetical protein
MKKEKDPRGRKPVDDKKVCLRLYILGSTLSGMGGEDLLRKRLYTYIGRTMGKKDV